MLDAGKSLSHFGHRCETHDQREMANGWNNEAQIWGAVVIITIRTTGVIQFVISMVITMVLSL